MISKQNVIDCLASKKMILELCETGDGMRGVSLFYVGNNMPIERIALMPWHVDQSEDELAIADKETSWFYTVFDSGKLSNQARAMLTDFCLANANIIFAWCNGDEKATLPQFTA